MYMNKNKQYIKYVHFKIKMYCRYSGLFRKRFYNHRNRMHFLRFIIMFLL